MKEILPHPIRSFRHWRKPSGPSGLAPASRFTSCRAHRWLRLFIAPVILLIASHSPSAHAVTASSVSKGSITWTFDGSYTVGQYVTGDWWVVGPVTINSISPAWDGTRHGAQINPVMNTKYQGLDTRISTSGIDFQSALNVADDLPLDLDPGDSLVSVKGKSSATKSPWMDEAQVLTVVSSAPPDDSFRPPYAGTDKTIRGDIDDIDWSWVRNLPSPAYVSTPNSKIGNIQIDWWDKWQASDVKTANTEHTYGRAIAYEAATAVLWLHLNNSQSAKEPTMIDVIQRGIDNFGIVKSAGKGWHPNGGHNLGRKLYLLVAARALNDSEMMSYSTSTYGGRRHWQEDEQYFYVDESQVGWQPSEQASGGKPYADRDPYEEEHVGIPDWTSNAWSELHRATPKWSGWKGDGYRFGNGSPNVGQCLAAELSGLRDDWDKEALFEYIEDRYWPVEEANRANAYNKIYLFHAAMWEAYKGLGTGGDSDTEAPTTPSDVSANDVGPYSVDLSWSASTDNEDVLGYYIYINGSNSFSVPTESATLTGLSTDTSYSIRISAYDAAGNESAQSSAISVTTLSSTNGIISSVSASSDDGNVSANAIDGNLGTRWSASGSGEWIQLDLDDSYTVEAISIAFYKGDERASSFDIQTSTNGTSWTTVYSNGTSSGSTLEFETFDITDSTAQYVRYIGDGNSVNAWNSLNEIELTIQTGTPDTTAPSTPTGLATSNITPTTIDLDWSVSSDNVAVTGYDIYIDGNYAASVSANSVTITTLTPQTTYTFSVSAHDAAGNESAQSSTASATTTSASTSSVYAVTASDDDGNVAANTLDGDFGTRWSADGDGEWIEFELDDTYVVTQVCIAFYQGDSRFAYFDLQTSMNGTTWTTVMSGVQSSGSTNDLQHFDIPDTEANYVRYLGHGNEDNDWNSLTEVEIIVLPSGSDEEPPTAPTNLSSSSVTTSSVYLSWSASTDNIGVEGYKVYTNGSGPVSVTGTNTTISGLTANTTYAFTVTAYDDEDNESAASATEVVTTNAITSATYEIDGHTGDAGLQNNGTLRGTGDSDIRVGGANGSYDQAFTMVFQLPTLGAGESLSSATLSFYGDAAGNQSANLDLYGIGYQSSSTVPSMPYYDSSYDGDSNATGIQDDIMNPSSSTGTITTDSTGDDNLVDFLNAQYAAGAEGGDYVLFRLSSDANQGNYNYYTIDTAESSNKPHLTLQSGGADTQAPSIPTGIASGNITQTTVDLSWSASTDNVAVVGYNIYTDGGSPVNVATNSVTITGLTTNTTYAFTITALDAAGNESLFSAPESVTTQNVTIENYEISGATSDAGVQNNGTVRGTGDSTLRVGGANSSYDQALVLVFQLPTLVTGETITDAGLSFEGDAGGGSQAGNLDLYGLGYQSSSTVSSPPYYAGSYGNDTNATELQNDIMTPSTTAGLITTDATGSSNLVTYLNALYIAGAVGGDYVLLRINPDTNEGNYKYWEIDTADSSNKPMLNIETEQ